MAYYNWNIWISGLHPSSNIPKTRLFENGSASFLTWKGSTSERANLYHSTAIVNLTAKHQLQRLRGVECDDKMIMCYER